MPILRYCFTLTFVFCFANAALAQYEPPASYYNSATGTGTTLKNQLQSIMSNGHIQRSYGDFRYSAAITDADPNVSGNILLVYDRSSESGQWNAGGSLPWNREHVWPQSLQPGSASNGTKGNLGDPHALRPSDVQINSTRGHRAFGFENTTGSYGTIGSDYYYTGDADRGDIARQLFYSATRYQDLGLTLVEGVPDDNEMGDLSSLIAYHYLDAPDEFELRRNHAIYSSSMNPSYYTNNRNAFIDRPEYVWSVYVDQNNDSRLAISGATINSNGSSTANVDLGRVLTGAAVPGAQSVTLNKLGNDGTYYEVTTSGSATSTLSGRYNAMTTGGADSQVFSVGLSTSTSSAGLKSGLVIIDNLDVTTSGGAGRGANDADDTLNVTLDVLDHATPSFAATNMNTLAFDFGDITIGSTIPTFDFDLFNIESTTGFTAALELDSINGSGDTSALTTDLTTFTGAGALDAGLFDGFTASFDTDSVGVFSASYTLSFSDEDIPGAMNLGELTLMLTGEVIAAVENADFTGDTMVDGADLLAWQAGFGMGTTLASGDANGDELVNADDLAIWSTQYGSGPSMLGSVGAVPEPTALLLLATSLLCFGGLRRKV
ncbi:endonuclease [Adhaeretor mobilis]|uniref:Extracellular ribonuclease n=1 Tax=Adhaeretor mobilis TaxID=1930276 RepID=A0A517MXV5_9BACT|nr:endonuclease [Adhaeretor mobilis]QDS99710.1 Extracellular ribonuclease precursor [Adhaeretor mobilis]